MSDFIKINCADDLPKAHLDDPSRTLLHCLVCVRRIGLDGETFLGKTGYVIPAVYDSRQKIWNFENDTYAINALINGNEKDFDVDCVVTHWMPWPKLPEEGE